MTPAPDQARIPREVQLAASKLGARLFRNQVGRYEIEGRWINTGLCTGSSDLIGWMPLIIGHKHVGMTLAQFLAVEVKTGKGVTSKAQKAFLAAVEAAGGLALVAHNVDELRAALRP